MFLLKTIRPSAINAVLAAGVIMLLAPPTYAASLSRVSPPQIERSQPAPRPAADITLSQTFSSTIVPANTIACLNAGLYHTENSYYRRFRFVDTGITTPFAISVVNFGIQEANASTGAQPITIKLYTIALADPLVLANLVPLADRTFTLSNQSLTNVTFPIPAVVNTTTTEDLVVEVLAPNGVSAQNKFVLGSNNGGESRPGYLRAQDCSIMEPTSYDALGHMFVDILITVSGSLGTVDIPGAASRLRALALEPVSPNPARADRMMVRFTLPTTEPAALELIDIAGRRLSRKSVESLGVGSHSVELGASGHIAPGVYLVKLTQRGHSITRHVAIVE